MRTLFLTLCLLCVVSAGKTALASDLGDVKWIGIGVIVDEANQKFFVLQVIPNGPAQEAGIREADVITAINDVPVAGLTLPQLLDRLRGELNSTVKVTINRPGAPQILTFSLMRKPVHINDVEWPHAKVVD